MQGPLESINETGVPTALYSKLGLSGPTRRQVCQRRGRGNAVWRDLMASGGASTPGGSTPDQGRNKAASAKGELKLCLVIGLSGLRVLDLMKHDGWQARSSMLLFPARAPKARVVPAHPVIV